MNASLDSSSILPVVLCSVALHAGLLLYAPGWDQPQQLALANRERSVRLVLPPAGPKPSAVEPEPEAVDQTSPEPEAWPDEKMEPVVQEPAAAPPPIPGPQPRASVQELPPGLEQPARQTPGSAEPAQSDPPPQAEPDPSPIAPDQPPVESKPVELPTAESPEELPPDPSPTEEPPIGADEQDQAEVIVMASVDPVSCPSPEYPRRARQRGWEGTVFVEAVVDARGRPTRLALHKSSGFRILDEAALDAVADWTFKPGTVGGRAAQTTVFQPVHFRLTRR